jgi:rhomboid protease GluP
VSDAAPQTEDQSPQPLPARMLVRTPQDKPIWVFVILALTVLVFVLQELTGSGVLALGRCPYFFSPDLPACYGLKVNELIERGQLWRLITPVLLHASILHIGFNMYALYSLGQEIERYFGHARFIALYMLAGFSGVVLSFLLTDAPSLGASTAVFGLLAAQGVFAYRNQRIFGRRARAALISIVNIAAINLLIGGLTPAIDNWGHVGGLLGGLVFAGLASPVYEIENDGIEFKLRDTTPPNRAWLGGVLVFVIFAALAAWRIAG